MATLYTKRDLADRALKDLRVVPIGDEASAEDAAKADQIVYEVLSELVEEALVTFDYEAAAADEVIPAKCFGSLADIAAERLAYGYGLQQRTSVSPQGQPESLTKNAMRRLRRAVLLGNDPSPTRAEYF